MHNSMVVFILFVLGKKYPFWTNLVQKSNCQFKLKFCTKINLNLQNSMIIFIFFCLRLEIPFLGKFSSKNQNCLFKLKFGTKTN